jgi:predicted metal-dependent phosphoesterase TrpH
MLMKKYDLHMHSYYSRCSRNKPEDILKAAKRAGLNGIAITDHHTMRAYPILKKLNKDKNLEIISGMEIKTQYGDVLALYIKKEIKSRDLFEVIREVRRQGGIIIIPHPFRIASWLRFRYPLEKLKGKIDAIEAFNSRNFSHCNVVASKEALRLGIPQVGSSDAHMILDIGNGYTMFDGDLRRALRNRKTRVGGTTKYVLLSGIVGSVNKRLLYPILGGHGG